MNSHFILSEISDFYVVINLLTANYTLPINMLTLLSVDEILLPSPKNFSSFQMDSELIKMQNHIIRARFKNGIRVKNKLG